MPALGGDQAEGAGSEMLYRKHVPYAAADNAAEDGQVWPRNLPERQRVSKHDI